eukprot:Skav211851  [mRNA]  locus=scaffold1622:97531:99003:- [translate_table: standard]
MECFAGVAAGGFAAKVQKFRVEQAELWRRDEYKMHVYLLVNVLLLGITVALWCQGKLPHTTPAAKLQLLLSANLAHTVQQLKLRNQGLADDGKCLGNGWGFFLYPAIHLDGNASGRW